jgi:hypothetical protein
MNDLILPALVIGALFLMMKKPKPADGYTLHYAAYAGDGQTPAHGDLYLKDAEKPVDGIQNLYEKTGLEYKLSNFLINSETGYLIG